MTNLQEIKKLISRSRLSLSDQISLIELYARANDADLEETLKLFTEDPFWIQKISENYKAKRAALVVGDSALWEKIMKAEEAQLKELGI